MTLKDVWKKTLVQLEGQVTENALNMWIGTLELVAYEDDAMVFISPSQFQKDIVMSKYKDVISATMTNVVGFDIDVNVVTPEERNRIVPRNTLKRAEENNVDRKIEQITASFAHPEFTF